MEGRLGKTSSFFFVLSLSLSLSFSLSPNHLEEEKQIRLIVLSSAAKKVLSQITCFKEGKNFKKEKWWKKCHFLKRVLFLGCHSKNKSSYQKHSRATSGVFFDVSSYKNSKQKIVLL